jgi:hypothetical protein
MAEPTPCPKCGELADRTNNHGGARVVFHVRDIEPCVILAQSTRDQYGPWSD